jgi:hypothetical protein
MNWNRGTALAILLVVFGASTPASAARPATPAEKAVVSALYGTRVECSKVTVSTVDARFARWDFAPSETCEQTSNGFGIARQYTDGQWRDVYQASESSAACPTTPLPTKAGIELKACSKPSKHIYITNFASRRARVKPRTLPHGAHSFLGRLRWQGWDRSAARARGVLDYSDRFDTFKAPIRLRADRVAYCGSRRIYTRLKLRFVRGSDHRRFPHFEATQRLDCPDGNPGRRP